MHSRDNAELTDAQLVNRFRNGDATAFDLIIKRYHKPLFTYLVRLIGDRYIADDIFQDTFLKVMKGLPDYREQSEFGSWLFGIAHRLVIDFFRNNKQYQKIFKSNVQNSSDRNRWSPFKGIIRWGRCYGVVIIRHNSLSTKKPASQKEAGFLIKTNFLSVQIFPPTIWNFCNHEKVLRICIAFSNFFWKDVNFVFF